MILFLAWLHKYFILISALGYWSLPFCLLTGRWLFPIPGWILHEEANFLGKWQWLGFEDIWSTKCLLMFSISSSWWVPFLLPFMPQVKYGGCFLWLPANIPRPEAAEQDVCSPAVFPTGRGDQVNNAHTVVHLKPQVIYSCSENNSMFSNRSTKEMHITEVMWKYSQGGWWFLSRPFNQTVANLYTQDWIHES